MSVWDLVSAIQNLSPVSTIHPDTAELLSNQQHERAEIMRTLSVVLTLLVAMGLCFVGCSDKIETVAGANEIGWVAPAGYPASLAKGEVVHSASGNAQLFVAFGGPTGTYPVAKGEHDVKVVTTFGAKLYADGTSDGTAHTTNAPLQGYSGWEADVTQLHVEGNIAKIMSVTQDPQAGEIHLCFVVVDNGEGNNAEPDLVTWVMGAPPENPMIQALYGMSASEALNWFIIVGDIIGFPGENEVQVGNVQVQ